MKQFNLIALLIAAFATSCTISNDSISSPDPEAPEEVTLSVSLPTVSRTTVGNKVGNEYHIYWSEDDCISVNGAPSTSIVIDKNKPETATFHFGESSLTYPLTIIYPHNSANSAESSKVVFQAEQSHTDGSFSVDNVPMYGVMQKSSSKAPVLKHLTGFLCLEMVAKAENIGLSTITVTSESGKRIAGEFSVDTSNGSLRPTTNTTTSIVYSLPEGYILSTEEKNLFHIALPATQIGSCNVEFATPEGHKMTMKWYSESIKAGVIREFEPITFQQNAVGTLQPLITEEDTFLHRYPTIYGYVRDTDNTPIAGVAVSDGFSVVTTDEEGFYKLDISQDAWYVFISTPAEYKVQTNKHGMPCFFKSYPGVCEVFNFTLERLPEGKENEFMLFGFADPQVSKTSHIERFSTEAVPEIRRYSQSLGKPCYGITLGDVISMGSTDLTNTILPAMRDAMHADKMGMPVFQVMGNHDNCYMTAKHPVAGNDHRELNLNIQRMFEDTFGPINYSFNRGDAHIVGMRDIQWVQGDDASIYNTAFSEEQYNWLKADLAVVPKDKIVVLCVHIPIYNGGKLGDGSYRQEVLSLLDEFAEAHVISGHTHYMRNYDHTLVSSSPHKIYEHAQAAVDGATWTSNINGDGVPNGYGVYHFDGNTIKDWYYKGYPEGMNSRDYQIRLYRGNAITGAAIPAGDANKNGTKGFYQFGYGDDILLANVFNSDTAWIVEVYENGEYSGKMTSLSKYNFSVPYDELIGNYVYDDPKRPPVGVECGCDFWAVGVLCGHLGMNNGGLYYKHCYQLWKYQLKDKGAKVEVRATDRKGNVYTCSKITDGTDMTYALHNAK